MDEIEMGMTMLLHDFIVLESKTFLFYIRHICVCCNPAFSVPCGTIQ